MVQRKELSLKEIQQGASEVLKTFKAICEEQGLEYCLYFGTLIGAVRHQGIIPWDDDIDVVMPRESYEKFLSYCREHKDNIYPFSLFHYSTKKNLCFSIARFSDTRYLIEEDHLINVGLGLFIDIYPFDETANTMIEVEKIARKITVLRGMCIQGARSEFIPNTRISVPIWIQRAAYCMAKIVGSRIFACILDRKAKKRNGRHYEYVGCSVWQKDAPSYARKEWMTPIQMPFEGELYPVPSGYDQILRGIYGDYMQLPSEENRVGHHYYRAYRK